MPRFVPSPTVPILRVRRKVSAAALAGLLLVSAACAGASVQRPVDPAFDLHHPDALRRMLAVQDVTRRGDHRWVTDLVELLEDPDDGVRLQAGAALREMTGHDVGYRAFDGPVERRAAVAAWRAWLSGWREGTARGGS